MMSFLERVEALCSARQVAKTELFSSAVDLFKGKAWTWFLSIQPSVQDWHDLVTGLRAAFLPSNDDETPLEQIKSRHQKIGENVAHFVSSMEELFGRLSVPLPIESRIKHIKRNLLPSYRTAIGLTSLLTIEDICAKYK